MGYPLSLYESIGSTLGDLDLVTIWFILNIYGIQFLSKILVIWKFPWWNVKSFGLSVLSVMCSSCVSDSALILPLHVVACLQCLAKQGRWKLHLVSDVNNTRFIFLSYRKEMQKCCTRVHIAVVNPAYDYVWVHEMLWTCDAGRQMSGFILYWFFKI